MSTTISSRRTHRKRGSIVHLSSDTTSTLPEYVTVGWHREEDLPLDRPPDYPDSAEEADEDTDTDNNLHSVFVQQPLPSGPSSPRRVRRLASHRRRPTNPNDPYLDSLLARSVHALEMSNTLLQSSMSTQSSLSTILASDSQADNTLEERARGLSSRIRGGRGSHETWVDDLEEISRGVEGLFEDCSSGSRFNAHARGGSSNSVESSMSSSLPTSSPLTQMPRHRRRPSMLELRRATEYQAPHLRLSQQDRADLVSPPPRAVTQYIVSPPDVDAIVLPSTLGLRAPPSTHSAADWRPLAEASSSNLNLHASLSSPRVTDRPLEPATPAYNMLSSFVSKPPASGSSTPSSFSIPSFLSSSRQSSRGTSTSTDRTSPSTHSRSSPTRGKQSPEQTRSDGSLSARTSRSQTPKQILTTLPHRPMTPTTEESSSSDSCPAKLTVMSLRKILEDMPPPTPPSPPSPPERPRPPAFLPRTPAPVAEAGTSTATASISRLFTKAKHSSSTRPPSPPRHSAMKQPTPSGTPPASNSALSIPDMLGAGVARAFGSAPGSGLSTPKRISFAELPESYAGSRPEGSSSKFRDKGKRKDKGKGKEGAGGVGWWGAWLVGAAAASGASRGHEERVEDKMSRQWGGRMGPSGFGPALDEWSV